MSTTLGALAVGAKIEVPVLSDYQSRFGSKLVFEIADKNHSGYPSNSVTLITEKIIQLMAFDAKEPNNSNSDRVSYGNNKYSVSNILQWLNSNAAAGSWYSAQHSADQSPSSTTYVSYHPYSTWAGFLAMLEPKFVAELLDTTQTVVLNAATDGGGYETVTSKMFFASTTEVGLANENSIAEGSLLALFSDDASRVAYPNSECVSNSEYTNTNFTTSNAWYWWLRTPDSSNARFVRYVRPGGTLTGQGALTGNGGVRPLCNLSSSILVSDTTNADGNYEIIYNTAPSAPSSITSPSSVTAGDTITVSCGDATDADGDAITYIFERAYNGGTWSVVQSSAAQTFTETALESWTTVQYRVKAQDSAGGTSAYTTGDVITVNTAEEPAPPEADDALLDAIRNKAPQDVRLDFANGTVIGTSDIAITSGGLTYTEILNGETDVTFGRAVMAELSVTLVNADGRFTDFDFTQEFTAKIGVKVGDAFEYVNLGVFKGVRPEKVRGKLIDFTAHDRMSLFDKPAAFADALTFPCTLGEIFTALCDFCGVGYVSAEFTNSGKVFTANPLENTDYTCREILGYIAEAAGSYARMSRDGLVELVWFSAADYTVTRTDRFEMTESEFETPPIDKLEVYNSYGDQLNTSGTGDIVYGISDNPFLYIENDTQLDGLQPYVDAIYSRITSLPAYHPSSFRAEFNPTVQCGDIISVVDDYDETISFPVFVQTITWKGYGKTTYENTGGVIRQNAPFTQRELEQIKKKSLRATDLYTTIDSYLNTAEGVASITSAVSGKFMAAPPTYTYSTPDGVTYGFAKTDDGYYTSTNAGVDSSYSYGVFTFENSTGEPQDILLRCISYGESNYDYGIISTVNNGLSMSNGADSSNVLKSFYGLSSENPTDVTVTIPAGTSTISFKYRKNGSVNSAGDYFKIMPITGEYVTASEASSLIEQRVDAFGASLKLSVTNGEKSSVIALTGDGISLSGTVAFTGEVVFKSDLSTEGSTTINGANITTGKISADRIDTSTLYAKQVLLNTDDGDYPMIASELSDNNAYVKVGVTDDNGWAQFVDIYGTYVRFARPGYEAGGDNRGFVIDMPNQRIVPARTNEWWLGTNTYELGYVWARRHGFYDNTYLRVTGGELRFYYPVGQDSSSDTGYEYDYITILEYERL